MNNLWSYIITPPSFPHPPLILASSSGRSILFSADPTTTTAITFSISLAGFHASNNTKTIWASDPIPLSTTTPLLLLLQLLHECIIPQLPNSDPARLLLALGPMPDTPNLLSLALLCRLFWLCAGESSADAGFFFFRAFDDVLDVALDCGRALRAFLLAAGADREERFMRSVGYMLAKWSVLRQLSDSKEMRKEPVGCCPAYAAELHGLWIMKGYAPVPTMSRTTIDALISTVRSPKINLKQAAISYTLCHQQLEYLVQLEYSICGRDPRFLKIILRVDNIRLHMARLAYQTNNDHNLADGDRHFPSRLRILVGPEKGAGAAHAVGPSLGRSTANPEYEVESTRTVKGGLGMGVRAKARWSARVRRKRWRWEQEAEGGAAVFEGVVCDGETGAEVAEGDVRAGMRRRFGGGGGLVVSGDELPEVVSWRVGREMEGKKMKWRLGVRVWVSYLPKEGSNGGFETRWVEWEEELELDVVAGVGCC